jgi:hypothetical protein
MEMISKTVIALAQQPLALVMILVAVIMTVYALVAATRRATERAVALGIAIVSGFTAWVMLSGWRWPK